MTAAIEVNTTQALERFVTLTQIPGKSGEEAEVAAEVVRILRDAGVQDSQIRFDSANSRTRFEGNCGNLIVTLPGNQSGKATLLSAHMDTVPICIGSQPEVCDGEVVSNNATGLGADDRAGCGAILTAAIERVRRGDSDFPPAVIAFLIQEEVGLEGARNLDVELVADIDKAFNFDGGTVEKVTIGAIGGERIQVKVVGVPAHAGVAPEQGVSAIVIAAKAIESLYANGWLGKVEKSCGEGRSNIGVIRGGDATNVVTPELIIRAEARSHQADMRTRIGHRDS